MTYYRVLESDDAVAEAPEDVLGTSWIKERMDSWEEVPFRLVEGTALDLLPSDAGWALYSERLRGVLDAEVGPADSLLWLPVQVFCGGGIALRYYVLWFQQRDSVLHDSSYKSGKLVVYVLRREALAGHRVFTTKPTAGMLIVHREVRKVLEAERITGMEFSRLPER